MGLNKIKLYFDPVPSSLHSVLWCFCSLINWIYSLLAGKIWIINKKDVNNKKAKSKKVILDAIRCESANCFVFLFFFGSMVYFFWCIALGRVLTYACKRQKKKCCRFEMCKAIDKINGVSVWNGGSNVRTSNFQALSQSRTMLFCILAAFSWIFLPIFFSPFLIIWIRFQRNLNLVFLIFFKFKFLWIGVFEARTM